MKLILGNERTPPQVPDPSLIAVIAKGRRWFTQIKNGEVKSVRALARHHGVDQGEASRIVPLGLLAPDLVDAILAGRQPVGLTATRLKRLGDLPLLWTEQRCLLGFA